MRYLILFLMILAAIPARAQESVYATGFTAPMGLEIDARGWLWVAEQGTGNDDGRISVVTPDGQVYPFLTGLRSVLYERSPSSAYHLTFHDGSLWAAGGIPTEAAGYVLRIDTTGFQPGDAALSLDGAEIIEIGAFVKAQGFAESNVYNLHFVGDDLYVVDAAANSVIKRDAATGELSIFATLSDLPNPTPVGPPFVDPVPTSITSAAGRIFVSNLTGFPFAPGLAAVYELGEAGEVSTLHSGLSLITDIAVDPRDGNFVVLQFGRFGQQGPVPETGLVLKLQEGRIDTVAAGLSLAAGLAMNAHGDIFVSSLMTNEVVRISTTAGPGRTFASGLSAPIGLEVDAQGKLWVAEQGTGNDDGQINLVIDGEVHPFVTGLRSVIYEGSPVSAYHVTFHDGSLWAPVGLSPESGGGYILRFDTTGFRAGQAPLSPDDGERIEVGSFVLAQGFAETNVYDVAFDDAGNLYAADAAANAILRRDASTGELSVLTAFPPLQNPTPVGPPVIQVVPTSVVYSEGRLFVGTLTGFPFLEGLARVYEVGLDGSVSVFRDGLTLVTDLAIHPLNGRLAVLQMGVFGFAPPPPGFRSHTGAALLIGEDGAVKPLARGINQPVGMRFDAEGNLYVASLADGEIRRIDAALVTAFEDEPEQPVAFTLEQNYPNPFNPNTTIRYTLRERAAVRLSVFNLLGQEVAVLQDGAMPAGTHSAAWDGRDAAGKPVASGIYLYRLHAAGQVLSRAMALVK